MMLHKRTPTQIKIHGSNSGTLNIHAHMDYAADKMALAGNPPSHITSILKPYQGFHTGF
jgi:hypothetical protein